MTTKPAFAFYLTAACANIVGEGYACMVCGDAATGHVQIARGPHNGRCVALVCARHGTEDGGVEFRARLVEWAMADLFDVRDGGPGGDGAAEVWHRDHLDPLPECSARPWEDDDAR